jgi:hypothetical protein
MSSPLGGYLFNHDDKKRVVQEHFNNVMDTALLRSRDFS